MLKGRRIPFAIVTTLLGLFTFSQVYQHILFENITAPSERAEEASWVASSHSWFDRKACSWFGICGLSHLDRSRWVRLPHDLKRKQQSVLQQDDYDDLSDFWRSGKTNPDEWSHDERVLREIPDYVIEYAPYIHLHSEEEFWPCDIAEHLIHTTPHLNYTPLQASSQHPNLTNLDDLNEWGQFVYLKSDDNVEERPDWLGGESNIPDAPDGDEPEIPWAEWDGRIDGELPEDMDGGRDSWQDVGLGDTTEKGGIRPNPDHPRGRVPVETPEGEEVVEEDDLRMLRKRQSGGRSDAPAVLIVVDKGQGVVDAFWFFFYSYNLGNKVFNLRFGNHVGDWEHTVVRFKDGQPKAVFFSEHNFGEAYSYEALGKIGKRPVGYSAVGTHAMYATAGTHPYVLPWGLLHDVTDRGPLWDPTLNFHSYTYDYVNDTLRSSTITPKAPTEWFYFIGHWGDKFYPLSDPRQYRFAGQYHYVNGPVGPRYKNLGRKHVCQGNGQCIIKNWIGGTRIARRWSGSGVGEEMTTEDVRRFAGREEREHKQAGTWKVKGREEKRRKKRRRN